MPSPLITVITKTSAIMARAVVELGFTPTSRSKVTQRTDGWNTDEANEKPRQVPSLEEYLAEGDRLRAKLQADLAKKNWAKAN
jgi:hypothetical protein